MLIVHQLRFPSKLQANSFEKFARDRYLPSLHVEATRAGLLQSARLVRRSRQITTDADNIDREFLLLMEWEGIETGLPRIDDPAVEGVFKSFIMEVTHLGSFDTVGSVVGAGA